jgi:hypothetical protein
MSTPVHLYDPYSPRQRGPNWLRQFVTDELHPWLVHYQQHVLDGLVRLCKADRAEREKALVEVQSRQNECLTHEPNVDDFPQPPSPDECWATLLVVHNVVCDPQDRIGTADALDAAWGRCFPTSDGDRDQLFRLYKVSCAAWRRRVKGLAEEHLADLRAKMRTVTATVPQVTSARQPIPLTSALTPTQSADESIRPVRVTPPARQTERTRRRAKRPAPPPKFKRPMKLLPKFVDIHKKARTRWTVKGFCCWLRSEHGISVSELEFSKWYTSYTRLKRRADGRG